MSGWKTWSTSHSQRNPPTKPALLPLPEQALYLTVYLAAPLDNRGHPILQLLSKGGEKQAASSCGHDDHTIEVVPLSDRRGPVTMGLLWITMVTGFPTVLIGFEWYKAGLTLGQVLPCVLVSCLVLLAYSIPASCLGSSSGQTYSLLSRSIFGAWGSKIVSSNLVWVSIAWYGLTANFLAEGLKGLYHIDIPTIWLSGALAIVMAFNNFFGFSGIANFARYLAAPVLIVWVGLTFFKAAAACPPTVFAMAPHQTFTQALTLVSAFVVGYGVWGNEPDYWRYGKPGSWHSSIPLIFALLIGQVLFPVTGWMMAYLTGITDMAAATNLMNRYAFGGISLLGAIVLIVTYFAVNDSGLYGAINGVENIKPLPRKKVVAALGIAGALAAAWLAGNAHAFELVATTSSIVIPSTTVIMLSEYFLIQSRLERTRNFAAVADFQKLPRLRWSALVALAVGWTIGFITSGLIPGLESMHVGVCSLQCWLTCLVVYIALRLPEKAESLFEQREFLEKLLENSDGLPATLPLPGASDQAPE